MGLFTPGYLKPGKGISANEPEKRSFFRFWEIIGEKFSKIIGLNIIYVLFSLPFIVLMVFIAPIDYEWIKNLLPQMSEGDISMAYISLKAFFAFIMFSIFGSGPISAVYAHIIRCFANRTPVWVISDGKDIFKENFKQSMILVLIDILVIFFLPNAMKLYYSLYMQTQNTIFYIAIFVLAIAFLIYGWMHFYIYQFMTTFTLTLRQIFKNSLLVTLGSIPFNLILTIISVAVIFAMISYLNLIFAFVIMCLLAPILTRMPIEFSARNRIKPIVEKAKKEAHSEEA